MIFENRYGRMDRLLHRFAFRARTAQRALADVEELVYRDALASIRPGPPVFVTGLPRSGTTILLELLWDTGCFATHTYRDMPFVLCPVLWKRFSRHFTVDDTARERAHGDGLEISATSPEAFEEMIWKQFWPGHYLEDRILPWTPSDANPEFDAFFEAHMRKMVLLRREEPSDQRRYLSKNNLNVTRLAAPPAPLRNGVFVVPFRAPLQQAASMLGQHRRFTAIHHQDGFVRRYMEAIGHHEFGLGLRPVNFGGWLDDAGDPAGLEFWLRYWTAAYTFVREHAGDRVVLFSYEAFTRAPERALRRLAEAIDVDPSTLVPAASRVQRPRSHDVGTGDVPEHVLRSAASVHDDLLRRSHIE